MLNEQQQQDTSMQNVMEHTILREQEVDAIANWAKEILRTTDEVAVDKRYACETMDKLIQKRFIASERNRDFLEDVAAFGRHNLQIGDMNRFHEKPVKKIENDNFDLKTPFQKYFREALNHLNLIEVYAEAEIKRLKHTTGKFHYTLKVNLPMKKTELIKSLNHAKQCVQKERVKKDEYDKELNFTSRKPGCFEWIFGSKRYSGPQSLHWHQTMAKAQYIEAIKLTDEAFEEANTRIDRCQKDFCMDYVNLLKDYITIEMNQHCRALEYLTLAFKFAMACEKEVFIPQPQTSRPSVPEIQNSDKLVDDQKLAEETLNEIEEATERPPEQYGNEERIFVGYPYANRNPETNVSPPKNQKGVSLSKASNMSEITQLLAEALADIPTNTSRPETVDSSPPAKLNSSTRKKSTDEVASLPSSTSKYSGRLKNYDDIINSNMENFMSSISANKESYEKPS